MPREEENRPNAEGNEILHSVASHISAWHLPHLPRRAVNFFISENHAIFRSLKPDAGGGDQFPSVGDTLPRFLFLFSYLCVTWRLIFFLFFFFFHLALSSFICNFLSHSTFCLQVCESMRYFEGRRLVGRYHMGCFDAFFPA